MVYCAHEILGIVLVKVRIYYKVYLSFSLNGFNVVIGCELWFMVELWLLLLVESSGCGLWLLLLVESSGCGLWL